MSSRAGRALAAVRAQARRTGFFTARMLEHDLVARTVYSPIPSLAPGEDPWSRRASLVGIDVDLSAQNEFFESALVPYLDEFTPRQEKAAEGEFYLWNGYYQGVDAEILYAMIRHLKPRRVLELGSGFSTLITARACAENASEGHAGELVAVDPEPRASLRLGASVRVERRPAQSLPLERYLQLARGDVLFVDTSHTVKLGSEVNFVVLEVLPRLQPGVVVHFHDIFLPFEYPRAWFERGTYLAEQYLLQAFLIENPGYKILLAVHALCREYPGRLAQAIPTLAAERENYPSAFWLVRSDGTGTS